MSNGNNNSKGNYAPVRRVAKGHYKFYLVHPTLNADADHVAERLMGIKNVEEVFVTDGDYGFIVKARFPKGNRQDDAFNYLSKNLGSNLGSVTSYYQYKK
jgi:DNA-binding Lrp family transcriptional regulator